MATYIRSDGTIQTVEPKNKKQFTAAELHKFVDGYIELVPVVPGCYGLIEITASDLMFCDEDGKRKGKSVNARASAISAYYPRDLVVGDVIIVSRKQVD